MTPADIWRWRNAVSADKTLFVSTRLVMLRLSFHADPDKGGTTWASQGQLAGEVGMPRSSVQRHLAVARDRGWLIIAKRVRNKADRYQLSYPDRTTEPPVSDGNEAGDTCGSGPIQIGPLLSDPDRTNGDLPRSDTSSPDVAPAESGLSEQDHGAASASAGAAAPAPPRPRVDMARLFGHADWAASLRPDRTAWVPAAPAVRQPSATDCAECGQPASEDVALVVGGVRRHCWCIPATFPAHAVA